MLRDFSALQDVPFFVRALVRTWEGLFASSENHRVAPGGILMARYDYAELHCSERECPPPAALRIPRIVH